MRINFDNKRNTKSLKVVKVLEEIEKVIPGAYLRVSRMNVPHLVIPVNGSCYSVAYFSGNKSFRIFYPYPGGAQKRFDRFTVQGVVDFFVILRKGRSEGDGK